MPDPFCCLALPAGLELSSELQLLCLGPKMFGSKLGSNWVYHWMYQFVSRFLVLTLSVVVTILSPMAQASTKLREENDSVSP